MGQTTAGVHPRWLDHLKSAHRVKSPIYNTAFSRAIRKHGSDVFESQVLSVAQTKQELDNLEKVWIILLQTHAPNGYNLSAGGEGNPGLHHTKESKEKISRNRKGKNLGNTTASRVWSDAQKHHMSEITQGRKFSAEHNEKIRVARTGVKRPDVTAANNKRWAAVRAAKVQVN